MTVVQVTRDSVSSDDGVRGPHLMAALLSSTPTVGEVAEWVVSHHYLAGLPTGDTWVMHLASRVGESAARFSTRVTDVPSVELVLGEKHSLAGIGCVHLEWVAGAETMED